MANGVLAVRVERRSAEEARKSLVASGCLDGDRLILQRGVFVELPVSRAPSSPSFEVVEQLEPMYKWRRLNSQLIRERLNLKGDEARALRHWELIGEVLVVRLPEGTESKGEIGGGLLKLIPRAKAVINRRGISGVYRRPRVEVIAGYKTETVHRENGCLFKLDPTKVMFSTGNQGERRRMAAISQEGEVVLDMFAGIGQFTVPLAKHSRPRRVYSVEKNPVAHAYLRENVWLNELVNVKPLLGDCRTVSPREVADRVIMGFFDARAFLPTAVQGLRNGGVIHYHSLVSKKELRDRAEECLLDFERLGRRAEVLEARLVKSYAPGLHHAVMDFRVEKG